MTWTTDAQRLWEAGLVVLGYTALCGAVWWHHRQRRLRAQAASPSMASPQDGHSPILIIYASQTGYAEELARQTAQSLATAGVATRVLALDTVDAALLTSTPRALFVISTYGEGDPPDNAALFVQRVMDTTAQEAVDLSRLEYAMLALGDRDYRHFCGFGQALDAWLRARGAHAWHALIEMDNSDEAALTRWREQLSHIAGVSDWSGWTTAAPERWTLTGRRLLNPDSQGHPTYHLELTPPADQPATWESGDLVQVIVPGHENQPREYSIASVPAQGRVHLLVRLARRADGQAGLASGWLTQSLALGDSVPLRLRAHGNFRLGDNADRPLILVGNGTGLAGLLSHLRARVAQGRHRNWLLFGERQATHDFYHQAQLHTWVAEGQLRLDTAFSRDQAERVYVQDLLRREQDQLRHWIHEGAAIYVCGSLEGMASGVHQALNDILGEAALQALLAQGRYRRDVY